ncbi:Asp23/Gls24 family envelope stress response protein [Phycicoccus sp. KQZ13P-1]|uniref:Asp23/Gls24 family envelope stress response protein n=1 Tax=Phycicoccus mangrovi TaxID=2840470 RepID=UPI001C00491D|nr:Asp23/Gls24 family envelope stress response protein [Phycicoccus mangrovi]MBT9257745.1 Asp23/Gls24 family envelope stress response protein [Phycicoccus mangrovi]
MSTKPAGTDQVRPPELADLVAAAVRSVPGIAGLHSGSFGEAATYLPGRRVTGVRLRENVAEVHVTLMYGVPVLAAAEQIRAAVAPLVSTPVEVSIEDVVPGPLAYS